jgi:hypothetical protein
MKTTELDFDGNILKLRERGYDYQVVGLNANVITPSGSVYSTEDLYPDGCPLCQGYLDDNPEVEETLCFHSEDDEREIKESKIFLSFIEERERLEFGKSLD